MVRRKFVLASALASLLWVIFSSDAFAQPYPHRYGGYHGGPYWGGATVGGSYAHGWADIIRSRGQHNLLTSEAAKNFEDARAKQLENRYKWTQTYFEMRRLNREYREAERGGKPTMEQLVRWAQAGKPDPLTDEQLDPYTGYIAWPLALRAEKFAESRYALNRIFVERSQLGHMSGDQLRDLHAHIEAMAALLQQDITKIDSKTYLEARRFLESLEYAAQL